jgi:hypothetical protein
MYAYEHTATQKEAEELLIKLRRCARKLHWISGGEGYDNMGKRESENLRNKLDEASYWFAALTRAMNAGGERAVKLGYTHDKD